MSALSAFLGRITIEKKTSVASLSPEDQIIFSVVEAEHAKARERGMISAESAIKLTIGILKKPRIRIVGAKSQEVFETLKLARKRLTDIEHGGVPLCRGKIDLTNLK